MKKLYKFHLSFFCLFFFFSVWAASSANSQWVQMSSGISNTETCQALASTGSTMLAGMQGSGVYRSTNNGTTWLPTSLNNQSIYTFYVSGATVYAGTSNGIYTSVNGGVNWTQSYLAGQGIAAILITGGYMYAGNNVSSNGGASWNTYLPTYAIKSLAVSGSTILAAASISGMWRTTNNGANWTITFSTNPNTFLESGANVYCGTTLNGLMYTSNAGVNWSTISLPMSQINSLISQGSYLIAGRDLNLGVFISPDGGAAWLERNQGFAPGGAAYSVMAVHYYNGYVFAGTFGGSVWRRSYSELLSPIGVQQTSSSTPDKFSLSQNYPNPFNPSTRINYELKITNYVTLKVFDLLGKEVAQLVNEKQNAGSYVMDFNSAEYNLPSGVYFYTLSAGGFKETKKMVLIK
ncbi:MAG: T9SS type A sorting domain-containing protein [Ignavibacteria bacterium]|nr:T9SS type A sorting domain-containing protein [Ignavibacteria bacterium]